MKYVFLLGRVLFSLIFILKPIEYFTGQLAVDTSAMNLPLDGYLIPIWAALAFLGGLSILFGFYPRFGAVLLVIFLLPTAIMLHPFWTADTDFAQVMHGYCFWKNFSLLGAALMISYTGTGPFSVKCGKKW